MTKIPRTHKKKTLSAGATPPPGFMALPTAAPVPAPKKANIIANFKAGKYFTTPSHYETMRNLLPLVDGCLKPDSTYDLRMWVILGDTGGNCIYIDKKGLTLAEYQKELDDFKKVCDEMPKEMKADVIADFVRNY